MASSIPAFVINLAFDSERRLHMTRELAAAGLEAEFVAATHGNALTRSEREIVDRDRMLRVYGGSLTDAELGCYLSHYRLWQRIVRERLDCALILEDDVALSPRLASLCEELAALRNVPWLVVRLSTLRRKVAEPSNWWFRGTACSALASGTLYRLNVHVLSAGAYLLRSEGASRLLEYGRRPFMPADQTMDRFWENGIEPYVVRPFPVRHAQGFASRIAVVPHPPLWRYGIMAELARRGQRISDSVRKRWHVARRAFAP